MLNVISSRQSPLTVALLSIGLAAALFVLSVFAAIDRPFIDLPQGAVPVSLNGVALVPTDTMPEPDKLGSYSALRAFFERQSMLAAQLQAERVEVGYATVAGATLTRTISPRPRGIVDLPAPFWFQQAVGILAIIVSGWVISLRRGDWGARMFALTGLFLAVSAMAASIYSTRQIALPGDQFRILSGLNHTGSAMFGIALVGLFMMYPRQLVRPVWMLVPAVFFGIGLLLELGYVGETLWIVPIITTQLLVAIVLGVVQWRKTRGHPVERAGLRWFLLFSLIGCSLFIGLSALPPILGLSEHGFISQAYAFGFFNLMHIGLALGVMRWRVFDLDRYAYYIWLWLAGVALIFATDLVLLLWMRAQPLTSLTFSFLIASFLYFPLRQFLLSRLFVSKAPRPSEKITGVFEVAFAPTKRLQDSRWDGLLKETFALAGEVKHIADAPDQTQIAQNGLALRLPAVAGLQGRELLYPDGGRRLFTTRDMNAADVLCQMYGVARDSHLAYERGITEERDRISRDVHDNIGAQLLTALHAAEPSAKDLLLRESLTDLRQIISDGFSTDFNLAEVIADLRGEMADRLDVHGIALTWVADIDTHRAKPVMVPYIVANNLRSILREITSNVIKHARATAVDVSLGYRDGTLELAIGEDGTAFDPATVRRGSGLDNISARVEAMGGQAHFDPATKTLRFTVQMAAPALEPA
ncbi:hypothetical protein ABMC88_16580 [Sulfitobacter sp. HNIBRBA2951]|uniref:sensor histidine kinase n=1 Tax=Sulfitobacter aquimarinus TaxID=3158557 RepID=UPI0032DEEF19